MAKKKRKKKRSAAYQRRDANTRKAGQAIRKKKQKKYRNPGQPQTFGQKVQKSDGGQPLRESDVFTGQRVTDVYNEDEKQDVTNPDSTAYARKQTRQPTSGQKVQKHDEKPGKEETSDFVKPDSIFKEQNYFSQPKGNEKGQADMEGYRCKDTYGQSLKKGGDYKKREREECQGKWKDNDSIFPQKTFSADAGAAIAGESSTEFIGSEKLQKKQKQAQKASRRVEKARAKLSKTREYAQQRVFDKETGKEECTMVPLGKEKPFRQEGVAKSAMRGIRREGQNFVHRKVSETEKENSAVEGAHRTEQKSEELFGFVKQQLKGNAQKQKAKVAKLEKRQFKKEASFRYQNFLEENPQMQKKALQKRLQKQRIKREYIKAKRKAATSKEISQAFEKAKNSTVTVVRKLQEFAQRNVGLLISAGIMAMLLMIVMFSVSSCGAMFSDTQSTILAASYLSNPKEIDATDLQFTRLEFDLQNEIDRVATDHPGYDEYSYSIGGIGHNPFTLINYLSAVHTEFTASGVESEVQALFDEMYTLTLTPDTETRTRTVTKIGTRLVINPITGDLTEEIYEYEVEEEYEVTILRVALTVVSLESIVAGKMNTEQAEVFDMYQGTGELFQEFASPLNLYWHSYVSSYYGYRKNPDTGNGELHRGVDIAVPVGTPVYAAHDGTVTTVAYDSHYGNYVVIEKDGYTTKYAHMDSLSVSTGQAVTQGSVIGTVGNTGGSTGSHLHIECLYNGEYYNPLFYFDVSEGTL